MSVHNERQILILGPSASVTGADKWYAKVGVPGIYRVADAVLVPDAAQTANGANFAVWTLRNETKARDIGTRSYAATNSAAGTPEPLTMIGGVNSEIEAGDVISWGKADTGTGLVGRNRVNVVLERWSS